ncbi:hypothetical protein HA402_007345 [Bradysia odoriphaga]|nr:hypothetical protein HA402_007345 [Bradysia odoriphaga]
MVHVTFNEKVECHQYSSTHTEDLPDDDKDDAPDAGPSNVRAQSGPKYTAEFLKGLRYGPHTETCPDAIMNSGIRKLATDAFWNRTGKSVPSRQQYPQNYRGQRRNPHQLTPFYSTYNQPNNGGNRDWLNQPIEPIGSSHYTRRHFAMAEYPDNFAYNKNYILSDGQHHNQKSASDSKSSNEEEALPLWVSEGPTSQTDYVELHGFEGPDMQEHHEHNNRNDLLACVDCNVSGGPTSGTSSNNGSPPAKSTPAKVTFNDSQRTKRPYAGRHPNWQNNSDNRQGGVAPLLNEIFKNFSAPQNQSNLRGLTPIVSVQDLESTLLYDRLKFRQMVAQMQQNMIYRNRMYALNEPIPNASQVLSEIDKILRSSNDPVYKRPEVRTLTKNIVESVIPPVNIMNLLKDPLTEPHNRETIQAALKVITQAKQNAAKAMKTHTPTESELRAHMDAILQDAIIKKRMENLSNELMKGPFQQGGRNLPNQSFHHLFRPNDAGRFEGHSQSDTRGQCQSFENGTAQVQDNNLNRWFSPNLLNKGQFPQIPSEHLRSEELENRFKQTLMGNDKKVEEVK